MEKYREIYGEAIYQLQEAKNTPAYESVKNDYFKLFEELAAADIRLIAGFIPDPYNYESLEDAKHLAEYLVEMDQELEILRRVNPSLAGIWELYQQELKDRYQELIA